ncbi:hypothetical protein C0Q87_16600 [Klebsiella aerogenes]|uniref:hypothetical protein n=1 Tax=Klebsiella aerogenes TaxID=548 RepID=UPI000C75C9EF|nr:hypothetical protein [Klebsiella aerogenes]EKZ5285940.1 hypothetical protein [Klebsiella aerogenes]MCR1574635.1 hypothetical protein [Klebsiella aerogenes]MDT4310686.1 hypothetical protein [Klebsiella aerogenes]PLC36760.1 hypothetical protein C0Q87_16600 [Klebsiella aerogenes]
MDKTAGSIVFVMDIKLYLMQKMLSDRQKNPDEWRVFYFSLLTSMDYLNLMIWTIIVQKTTRRLAGCSAYAC